MNLPTLSRARLAMAALLGCAMCCAAYAQQTPITGQMGSPAPSTAIANNPTPSTPASSLQPSSSSEPTSARTEVGSVTRQLFAMQSQGTSAGKALPIPGQEASASYQRYLKSFEHPIPEFYETAVSKNSGGGSSASGGP